MSENRTELRNRMLSSNNAANEVAATYRTALASVLSEWQLKYADLAGHEVDAKIQRAIDAGELPELHALREAMMDARAIANDAADEYEQANTIIYDE